MIFATLTNLAKPPHLPPNPFPPLPTTTEKKAEAFCFLWEDSNNVAELETMVMRKFGRQIMRGIMGKIKVVTS